MVIDRGPGPGIAMEVHHAIAEEVATMIKKKDWALALLRRQCPRLVIKSWNWIVPKGKTPFFTQDDPRAFALYHAGIEFPMPSLVIS